jgi:hypothetical protein
MKHFTQLLIELGYEPWRESCIFPNQNPDARNQNKFILENKEKYKVIFTEGDEKEGTFYFKSVQPYYDFSTMRVGGIYTYWVKGKDFKNSIVWGLSEFTKPPTLVNPRPKIKLKTNRNGREVTLTEKYDDAINICLQKETCEDVYKALFDKNMQFNYETN